MKKLSLIFLAFCVLALVPLHASAAEKFAITGAVIDKLTEQPILNAEVRLIDTATDSVLVSKKAVSSWFDGTTTHTSSDFDITGAPLKKDLVVEFVCPGYETLRIPVDISKISRRNVLPLNYVLLKREPRQLKEVTVTASKVKFYHKGDTIVYNADAFITSEGSMLDALIRQLTGVEIKDGGCR